MATTNKLLPLTEVVGALRREIAEAVQQAQNEALLFQLNSVELEFSVVAKREVGADARIKFSVLGFGVEGGAAGKAAQEQTQSIKLSLTPLQGGAQPDDEGRLAKISRSSANSSPKRTVKKPRPRK